jgi:hypothetical protein
MFPAPQLLALLIIATPALLIFDGPIIQGLVMVAVAVSVAFAALRIRPGEVVFLSSVIRPIAIVAVIPAIWMVFQVLPLKGFSFANPIWDSAATALGQPVAGRISIDPGATLVTLARYLSAIGVVFVAAAIAVDRHRVEWILLTLTTATTIIALLVLMSPLHGFAFSNSSATDSAALGVNLATATALHTFGQGKWRKTDRLGVTWFKLIFSASVVACAVCSLAVLIDSTSKTYFAVICGVSTMAVAIAIRYFRLSVWGYSAIISLALIIAISAILLRPGGQMIDLTLAYADREPAQLIEVARRVLAETSWAGTGAGTFAAVLPIFQDINDIAAGSMAPTAAVAIAVEMGRPFLWAILMATIILVIKLLHGALRRGRDSLYAIGGAGCIVTMAFLAFCNVALFSLPVIIIGASAIGTAIAQSKSRSYSQSA